MLKLAGICLILLSGAGLGFGQSYVLGCREKNLEQILRMTMLLRGEIRFGSSSLREAFRSVSHRMEEPFASFLRKLSLEMEEGKGASLGVLFRACAEETLSRTALSREERENFCALGDSLGYLDLEMQLRQLELYEKNLELALRDLRLEMPSKRKIYRSLGVLGAVLLVILVW